MHFRISPRDTLPLLSWLLDWRPGSGSGQLICGRGVETRPDSWFEGVWGGCYDRWDFDRSANVFGSGGRFLGDRIFLVPPSHPLESLFLMRRGESLVVSNSLAFLLAYTGSSLRADCFDYAELFLAGLDGIENLRFDIKADSGAVTVFSYYNAMVGADARVHYVEKTRPPFPRDFRAYVDHMLGAVQEVGRNARSARRNYRYDLLATLSSGYDSPACAVFAKAAGCADGITFRTSLTREGSTQQDDSGLAIGGLLGIQVREYSRALPPPSASATMTQFYCDGGLGGELFWQSIETELPQKALITGIPGGAVWKKAPALSKVFEKSDCAGMGLGEFRRKVGFAHLPVAYIMSTRISDIQRISNSPEMQPWSIGGDYDKPIARRIVEEAGIPREMFGQVKSGNSFRAWYPDHWPAWFAEQYRRRKMQSSVTVGERLRYALSLARYQALRFSCERRFIRYLSKKMSLCGYGETIAYRLLNAASFLLRMALKPFKPPHYKIIIRMHPRYTFLLRWANADAALSYTHLDMF